MRKETTENTATHSTVSKNTRQLLFKRKRIISDGILAGDYGSEDVDDYGAPRENTPNVPAVSQPNQITTFQNERRPWLIFQANILRITMVNIFRISSSLKTNALWTLSVVKAQVEVLDPGASPDRWDPRDRLEYQATREFRGECFRLQSQQRGPYLP